MGGKKAQFYLEYFPDAHILTCGHPSPYSSHLFFGNQHFIYANQKLIGWQLTPIDWHLD